MIAEEIEVSAATPNVSVSLQIESFQGWGGGRGDGGEVGEEEGGSLITLVFSLRLSRSERGLMRLRRAASFKVTRRLPGPYLFDTPAGTVQLSTQSIDNRLMYLHCCQDVNPWPAAIRVGGGVGGGGCYRQNWS